jgi:hypothetical protein
MGAFACHSVGRRHGLALSSDREPCCGVRRAGDELQRRRRARARGTAGSSRHVAAPASHRLSGYRTPQHSVEVGGFASDPHTRGQASDTPGVEGVGEATLEAFGLTRPFAGAAEANHIQLHG